MPSSILVSFGGLDIHWYGLILAVSLLVGYKVFKSLGMKNTISSVLIDRIYTGLVVWGFLGARAYHVLNDFGYYSFYPLRIFAVWQGGLAIHGAILGGLGYLIYLRYKKVIDIYKVLDVVSPALLIGQGIGRLGNYFNQELFGLPTNFPWGIYISEGYRPEMYTQSSYFHPTFAYEMILDLIFSLLLIRLIGKSHKKGSVFALYLILYGVGRVAVELLRIDNVPLVIGIRLPLIMGSISLLCGSVLFLHIRRQQRI